MEFLFGIAVWIVFAIFLSIHLRVKRQREEREMRWIEEAEVIRRAGSIRVNQILTECFVSLTRQRAKAYGPWIPSLLDGGYNFTLYKDSRGRVSVERQHRVVSPKVALTAVRFTMKELAGSRFDLSELSSAEAELLEMGA